MTEQAKNANPEDNVSEDKLQEVSGGNSIHKRRLEQLDTHDSSKNIQDDKDFNIHERRLEQLDTHDSSK